MHREIDEDDSAKVEQGEDVKVGCEPEMVGNRRRDKPPDQVARYLAGDTGSVRAGGSDGGLVLRSLPFCASPCHFPFRKCL